MTRFRNIAIGLSLAALVLPASALAHGTGRGAWDMVERSGGKILRSLNVGTVHNEKSDANTIGRFSRNDRNKKLKRVTGTVSAMSDTSITITIRRKSGEQSNINGNPPMQIQYTFAVDANTMIIRKFKAKATLNEIAVGDTVRIWATSLTNGTAKMIWDKSIWWLGLQGTIGNLSADHSTFNLIVTKRHIEYSVNIATDTFTKVMMGTTVKSVSDLATGQKVTLRGSWNSAGHFFLAKTISIAP